MLGVTSMNVGVNTMIMLWQTLKNLKTNLRKGKEALKKWWRKYILGEEERPDFIEAVFKNLKTHKGIKVNLEQDVARV